MSIVVVKLGGSSLQNSDTLGKLTHLIGELKTQGFQPVIIHGGGPAINQALTSRGITWQFINGQRQTTLEMMSVIEDVLAVQINSQLVLTLNDAGIPAVGMSGASHQMLFCTQANEELQQVGQVQSVHPDMILKWLQSSEASVPVIAPIGVGAQGEKYNINADWAAAKIAVALKAEKLIFLTDQKGILDHNKELVTFVTPAIIHNMVESGVINGGMYTKVITMMMALQNGVREVQVLHASDANLFGQRTLGTRLVETTDSLSVSLNKNINTKEVSPWK